MSNSNSFRFASDLVFAIAVLAISIGHTAPLQAQLVDWTNNTGATSPWYHDGGNWSGGSTPGSTETARFNQTGAYEVWWNETTANTNPNVGFLDITQGDVTFLNNGGDSQWEYTINGSGARSDFSISGVNTEMTLSGLHVRSLGGGQVLDGATLTLDGSHAQGTRLTIDGAVGFDVSGTLNVGSGASLSTRSTDIGLTSSGAVTVSGNESSWHASNIWVGRNHTGSLSVISGGTVDNNSKVLIGSNNSSGTVTVDGPNSTMNAGGLSVISGTLEILAGGKIDDIYGSDNLGDDIGSSYDSNASALVSGSGSSWNTRTFFVGSRGTGSLRIEDGGLVNTTGFFGIIGFADGSTGTATVTGQGSSWSLATRLLVGNFGSGTLNIENGGRVSNFEGTIGHDVGSGVANVSGLGSTWDNSGSLYVGGRSNGAFGTGVLTISDNGQVNVGGETKLWNTGTLTLDGGSLTTSTFDNTAGGNFNFNSGTLAITDSAQSLSVETNSFQLANGTTFNTNAGTTTLANGQHLNVAGDTTVASNATLNLNGGSLTTRSFDNTAGGTFQFNDGTLQVAGGVFNPGTNDFTIDGNSPAANPTLMLTDGASGSFTGGVTVGNNNSGGLALSGGSQLSSRSARLGVGTNSTGIAEVAGAGSAWDVEANFIVGDGMLSVNSGGRVSSGSHSYVGYTDDSNGTVSVSGAGSEFNPWVLYIGTFDQSYGVVDVESGGKINSGGIGIGGEVGSAGELNVTGGVVDLTVNPEPFFGSFFVGWWGTGSTTITDGGSLDAVWGRVGWTDNANGSILVSGENSRLSFANEVHIGDHGSGSLTIQDGGLVEVQNALVGVNAPGPGTGNAGTGTGNVIVTGNDSRFLIADKISIGENGNGTMTVSDGGVVTSQNVGLGEQAGSNGVLTVDGGSWTGVTNFSVGGAGKGTMNIRNGGTVSNLYGYIGSAEGIRSSVEMDGGTWHSQQLYVGNDHGGTGSLNAVGGSQLNTDFAYVGRLNGASGIVTLSGQDTVWNNSLTFLVGFDGNGTMNVEDGGRFDSADTFLGYYENRTGSVMVSDAGSQFNNANSLRVGFQGNGDLQINNGGVVTNNFGFIGWFQNSDGNVSVSDAGSRWQNNQSLYIGGPSSSGAGKGRLQIVNGGSVHVGNQLEVRSNGTLQIDGGHLQASTIRIDPNANFSMDAGSIDSPMIFANELIINGGTIDFERLAAFDSGSTPLLSQFGGVLAPGDSPGSTTIEGDYLLHAGTIEIELAGTTPGTEYDTIDVFGDFTINSGNLSVSLLNGFNLQFGQEFGFFNIGGALNGMFANLNEGDVVMSQNNVDLFITYSGGDGNDIRLYTQAVPEPGAAMLFGISCLMAGCHRRRRTSDKRAKINAVNDERNG